MPPQAKPTTKTSEILDELKSLNTQVEDLYDLIDRTQRKHRKNRITNGIMSGLLNAVGVVIGTLVITAVLLYAGQAFIRSEGFQNWLVTQLEKSVSRIVTERFQF